VRDRFSGDTWRILGRLEHDGRAKPGRLPLVNALALTHNLIFDLAAFNGMEMENMTRGRGWRFLDFGRRVERGLSLIKLVQAAVRVSRFTNLQSILEIADSVMTYRRNYFAEPRWPGVLELLLRDETNPRSLAFQISILREHASALVIDPKAATPVNEQDRLASLATSLASANLNHLAAEREQSRTDSLLELLFSWSQDLAALSEDVTGRYFTHTVPKVH
jgi:uncharacterized alpha-E superfamily protein